MTHVEPQIHAAYHEAGHAVAAIAHGFELSDVSIVPSGRFLGTCLIDWDVPLVSGRAVESALVVILAGDAAAQRVGVPAGDGADDDSKIVSRVLRRITPGPREASNLLNRLRRQADRFFERDAAWDACCSLANELFVRGQVPGDEALHIVFSA